MMRVFYFIRYVFIFLKELMLANFEVVMLVLSPTIRIKPGFLALPLEAQSDFEITSLANSLTLTPGTIAVHVSQDRKTLVIHALHVGDDPDAIRRSIKQSLEANILKWTRSPRQRGASQPAAAADRPTAPPPDPDGE